MEWWMDLGLQCNDLRCIHYRKMLNSCVLIKLIWKFLIKFRTFQSFACQLEDF